MTRPLRRALPCALVLLAAPLGAQSAPRAVEDSAAAARAHFRSAGEALQGGDSLRALALLERAAVIWPRQPAYPRAQARLAGRLGLTPRALPALEWLTLLGQGWPLDDPALAPIAADPGVQAASRRNLAATAPMARSRVLWEVGDAALLVEGVAVDSVTGRYFISSVRSGRILVRLPDGTSRDFAAPESGSRAGVLGMVVDHRRGLLWAATAEISEPGGEYPTFSGKSSLVGFDLLTGARRAVVELPPAPDGHQLGDVIVTPRGTLYTSDSRSPLLFRVPAGPLPAVAEVVVSGHPSMRSLQGMAVDADESVLYLADYSHGLLRVDLRSRAVSQVIGPGEGSLLGIDGLAAGGAGQLIAVQNGIVPVRVVRLHLDPAGRRVTRLEVIDRPELAPGEATLGARVGDSFVYVATVPAVLRQLDLRPR
jgi:sugar lactone lactonase YvrE